MANKFDVNRDIEGADVAGEGATLGRILAQLAPMLIMMFMVIGAMMTTTESIAGEKERGTLATLLITPISRGELAAGKILSLGIEAFLCGLSSILGIILSLPTLIGSRYTDGFSFDISAVYGVFDYLSLILVVLPSIFLAVTLVTLISAYARNVKEAGTSTSFLLFIDIFAGVSAMFDEGAKQEFYYYLIPFYNSTQCMVGIFTLEYSALNLAITIAANALYTVIGAFCLAKMFGSEKIMFSR
jgi:sodium transport system permease protein